MDSEAYEERAAIIEYDAELPRDDAQAQAAYLTQCRDCAHFIPSPPAKRASGAAWDMPGGCAQGLTTPDNRPPIYPCTGWYCKTWERNPQ